MCCKSWKHREKEDGKSARTQGTPFQDDAHWYIGLDIYLPIPSICFPQGYQTGQGPSSFLFWTADYLSVRPSLFCCRVGSKVISDWEKWIICVYTWTDLQNLHFCGTSNILVLSTLESLCTSLWQHMWPGRAESSRDECQPAGQAQPSCITSLLPRTL